MNFDDNTSIASDFSIIPESMMNDDHMSSVGSEYLRPSIEAEEAYGKVKFLDIQSTYPFDSDIVVSFVIDKSIIPKTSDRIAIFKVGFKKPLEYIVYEWISSVNRTNTDVDIPHSVKFKASNLPSNDNEFYQFCYVTSENRIVGVSRSFQFISPGQMNLQDISDEKVNEEGLVVISSEKTSLLDRLSEVRCENVKLQEENHMLQNDCKEVRDLLEEKNRLLAQCDNHNNILKDRLKEEVAARVELDSQMKTLVERCSNAQNTIQHLQRQVTDTSDLNKELETNLNEVMEERSGLREKLKDSSLKQEEMAENIAELNAKLDALSSNNKTLEMNLQQCKIDRKEAQQELEMWTSRESFEREDRVSLELKLGQANEQLETKTSQMEMQYKQIEELESKLEHTDKMMENIKNELVTVCKKLSAEEEQRKSFEERQEVVNKDNDELKATIAELKQDLMEAESNKLATEKIATEMSQRLQTSREKFQDLTLVNLKLAKKLKKIRKSQSSVQLSMATESDMVESLNDWSAVSSDVDADNDKSVAASMLQESISGISLDSNPKFKMMENSIRQLTSQVVSLQTKLNTQNEQGLSSAELNLQDSNQSNIPSVTVDVAQSEQVESGHKDTVVDQTVDEKSNVECKCGAIVPIPQGSRASSEESEEIIGAMALPIKCNTMLYGNSFLPSATPTPPIRKLPSEEHTSGTGTGSSFSFINPPATSNQSQTSSGLPEPLEPERTAIAKSTEIMHRLSLENSAQDQESDNDHYHDVSEEIQEPIAPISAPSAPTDESTQTTSPNVIYCPFCPFTFEPAAISLLQEHVDRHLDPVCPICNVSFHDQKRLERHVYDHFENERPVEDSSGPWTTLGSFMRVD